MAQIATKNPDDALDILQDAMLNLVEKYPHKPEDQWRFLFFKILQSRITDWHRRRSVRAAIMKCVKPFSHSDTEPQLEEIYAARAQDQPDRQLERDNRIEALKEGLSKLPLRQQQAFLLRLWEGFDVRQTAAAMSRSEGSVKTRYSRAVHSLRAQLEQLR